MRAGWAGAFVRSRLGFLIAVAFSGAGAAGAWRFFDEAAFGLAVGCAFTLEAGRAFDFGGFFADEIDSVVIGAFTVDRVFVEEKDFAGEESFGAGAAFHGLAFSGTLIVTIKEAFGVEIALDAIPLCDRGFG